MFLNAHHHAQDDYGKQISDPWTHRSRVVMSQVSRDTKPSRMQKSAYRLTRDFYSLICCLYNVSLCGMCWELCKASITHCPM